MLKTKLKKLPSKGGGSTSAPVASSQIINLLTFGLAGSIIFIGFCVYTRMSDGVPNNSNGYQVGLLGGNSDVKVKIGQPVEALADDDDVNFPNAVTAADDNHTPEIEPLSTTTSKEELTAPVTTADKEQSLHTPSSPLLRPSTTTDSSTSTTTPPTLTDAQQKAPIVVSSDRSTSGLFKALDKARDAFFEKLKIDYGVEQYENMFFTTTSDGQRVTRGRTIMSSPSGGHGIGVSFDRLQRKFVKKILQAQSTGTVIPLVWVTGGHSGAAGHGNLYNESYSAVLERNGVDMFNAVGLRLEGRNFAMGTTTSGMEIASCIKEVFGQDVDILSWDYGMSDVNRPNRMELYMYHAFASGNRPACIGLNGASKYKDVMKSLEERGLTVLFKDDLEARVIDGYIPDTLGKSQAEIDAMPVFLQSFKCGNTQLELGEPTCATSKFTNTHDEDCEKRRFRVSWHPGWKSHALVGNLITLFLMEVLYDALRIIQARQEASNDKNTLATATQMLLELQQQEDADYNFYQQSDIPPLSERNLQLPNEQQKKEVLSIIYKQPSYCHTARLPAVIRHEGILTLSQQKGFFDYDKGIELKEANEIVSFPNDTIPLVYDQSMRQKCKYNIQVDYRDFFYLHGKQQDDSKLLLPNVEEQRVYGTGEPTKGIVAICFSACDQNRCPKESIKALGIMEGKVLLHINDVPVSNLTVFGETEECYLLTNEEHGPYWKANDNDQYEIRGRVHDPEMNLRISSFVIW